MYNFKIFAFLFSAIILLSGCANKQPNVPMEKTFWSQKEERIGIGMNRAPTPGYYKVGAQGLLDMAINSAVTSELGEAVKSWNSPDIAMLANEIKEDLEDKGYHNVSIISQSLKHDDFKPFDGYKEGYSDIDLSPLKSRYNIDKLVLLTIGSSGISRSYYGFIPTSDPAVFVNYGGSVIDLDDNRYIYFKHGVSHQAIEGEWDQPPEFSNLKAAYNSAVEKALNQLALPYRVSENALSQSESLSLQ